VEIGRSGLRVREVKRSTFGVKKSKAELDLEVWGRHHSGPLWSSRFSGATLSTALVISKSVFNRSLTLLLRERSRKKIKQLP